MANKQRIIELTRRLAALADAIEPFCVEHEELIPISEEIGDISYYIREALRDEEK